MVQISKDQARIISAVLESGWDFYLRNEHSAQERHEKAKYLQELSDDLWEKGQDQRRTGRTSNDGIIESWKRALKKGVKDVR